MLATIPLEWTHPWISAGGVALAAIAVWTALRRRPALPLSARLFALAGLLLLAAAAGQPFALEPAVGTVNVMVDLSPSTRTAGYRDWPQLQRRLDELLRRTPHRTLFFAQSNVPGLAKGVMLPDLPADQTRFTPPPGDPVLLFSDGRFDLPQSAPPVYAVLDSALNHAADAAIQRLEQRGSDIFISITNTGKPRELFLSGVEGPSRQTITSSLVITRPLAKGATRVVAHLSPGDDWPENDTLSLTIAPSMASQRWWVGSTPPSDAWRLILPAQLPTDAAAYLAPSIIVLDNLPASALGPMQEQRLTQYVRDLGGSLLISGGDHAFAAGQYFSTPLETLSPLASSPPNPTVHWILLADASGSMNDLTAGPGSPTRWQATTAALVGVLPQLPPDDLVSVGCFADNLKWWVWNQSVRLTLPNAGALPPPGATPSGPTNLEPALAKIADAVEPALEKHLLLITDADTVIEDPDKLAAAFAAKKIHLHLLAIEEGKAIPALKKIIDATHGTINRQFDPQKWTQEAIKMLERTMPERLIDQPAAVRFLDMLGALPSRSVHPWNLTWLKSGAHLLADATVNNQPTPMAALWPAGTGQVAAFAFAANSSEVESLAAHIAQPPRDPRFAVTWQAASPLRVVVDAVDNGKFLNDQKLNLEIAEEGLPSQHLPLTQIAPGRYQIQTPAPHNSALLSLFDDAHLIDRTRVAGRYPPEFDAIGSDIDALHELSHRTSGHVIPDSDHTPIDFHWPLHPYPLTSLLATSAAVLLVLTLAIWRRKE